jgi:hypothetical protein
VTGNKAIDMAAEIYNSGTGLWSADPNASLSLLSNMSAPLPGGQVTINNGLSSATFYYRITNANTQDTRIRMRYADLNSGPYSPENYLRVLPSSQAQVISSVTVDTGILGSATTATITPDHGERGARSLGAYKSR